MGKLCEPDRVVHHQRLRPKPLNKEVRTAMLCIVLCRFHASIVKDLVVKLGLNFQKWWTSSPKSRAAIPVVVWCCRASFRNTLILAVACRLSLGVTIRLQRKTANRHSTARQLWGSSCLVRPSISSCLITASSFGLCNAKVLEAAGCSR